MIKLVDFLIACKVPIKLSNYKMHLATGYPNPPLESFLEGRFKEWQECQTRRNFPCEMVISLIELKRKKWLFAGVYKILGCEKRGEKHFEYSTELLDGQDELIGRVIVFHERKGRQAYLIGKPDGGEFYISEIREKRMSIEEFPGYNNVVIPFRKLGVVISQAVQSWKGALSNVKGVYLITDTLTGKHYVGSATGDGGIWHRWSGYVLNGHGGVKELEDLLKDKGESYKENFQYSILEIADSHSSDGDIAERESYWKDALRTRELGYNSN